MDQLDCDNFVANRLIRSFGMADTLDRAQLEEALQAGPVPAPKQVLAPIQRFRTFVDVPDEYLIRRGLERSAVDHFGIRWNPRMESWVLPIRSPGNVLLGWQEKGPGFVRNRPPGVQKGSTVFGAEHLNRMELVVLVESPLDVAYLHGIGYDAAASFGAGVSDEQMRLLAEYASSIVLALDNDEAGIENMVRVASGYSYGSKGRRFVGTPWASRVPMKVIRYRDDSPKDVGEMEIDEVVWAIEDAVHILDWLAGMPRGNHHVSR